MKKFLFFVLLTVLAVSRPVFAGPQQSIEIAFSPDAGATDSIVRLISEAKHTIRVAAYSFTSKDIAAALLNAHKHGIDVQVVLDKSNAKAKYSSATFLANVGVPTRINYKYAIMHSKFMVVDEVTVETGSFNYTKAAEQKNAENVIILRNYPDIAAKYQKEWQKLWNEAQDYQARY